MQHQTSATNNSGGNQLPRINESQNSNSSSSMNIDEEQVAEMLNNPDRIRFPDNNS